MSYTPPNANGQDSSANSAPAVLSTEQEAILTGINTKGVQSAIATNSTITPLNNGNTFTGTGEQNQYSDVFVVCKTDQSGLLYFDFSVDNTNWETFPSTGFTVTAGIQEAHKAVKAGRYFRVRMTNNSGSNQTYLRLYTYYGNFDQLNAPLTNIPSSDADSITTKSVIIGQTDAGQFKFVGVDEKGNLKTAIENPKTAFGELSMAELTPVAQISFEYSSTLNTQLVTSAVTGIGTVTATGSLSVPRNYGQYINLEDLDIFASPSDIISFAMKTTTSGTCAVAANWVEDI